MMIIERNQIEQANRRSRFEDLLRHFVREWAPDNDRDRYEMSMQLMSLMRDAMQYQTFTFGAAIESYAAQQLLHASMVPLNAIFDREPKK